MKTIYVFLATGFEDIEALTIIDVCRRAALPLQTVSVTGERIVTSSHQVGFVADMLFDDADYSNAALLFLPGGMPGAANLAAHSGLNDLIRRHYEAGRPLAAICAAPLVFGRMGLLAGHRATCYPGFEPELQGATVTGEMVVEDAPFLLGKGPAAALPLAYAIVAHFCGQEKADQIAAGMLYRS